MKIKLLRAFLFVVPVIALLCGAWLVAIYAAHAQTTCIPSADGTTCFRPTPTPAVEPPSPHVSTLRVPYISQYQGQATQLFDCGPAAVAMVVVYNDVAIKKHTESVNEQTLITQVRNVTGKPGATDTFFPDLEKALAFYGLPYTEISNAASPQPTVQIAQMQRAIISGNPVIALVHGADLGRGEAYGDLWVVVRGFSADQQTVYLNDPDDQAPRSPAWVKGGPIALSMAAFSQAAYDSAPGPYGIIVDINSGGRAGPVAPPSSSSANPGGGSGSSASSPGKSAVPGGGSDVP